MHHYTLSNSVATFLLFFAQLCLQQPRLANILIFFPGLLFSPFFVTLSPVMLFPLLHLQYLFFAFSLLIFLPSLSALLPRFNCAQLLTAKVMRIAHNHNQLKRMKKVEDDENNKYLIIQYYKSIFVLKL